MAEILDSNNRRDKSEQFYRKAASIAASWKNDSRASYFYFRHACKLMEKGEYRDAEELLNFLYNADWLEQEFKLTVISQLCLIADATKNDQALEQMCSSALSLIDELIRDASSAERRRHLLISKGNHLTQFGLHEKAVLTFEKVIQSLENVGDQAGVAEGWFQIASVMQKIGDKKRQRSALEKVIALEVDNVDSIVTMFTSLALVQLAQLNISQQRFAAFYRRCDEK